MDKLKATPLEAHKKLKLLPEHDVTEPDTYDLTVSDLSLDF